MTSDDLALVCCCDTLGCRSRRQTALLLPVRKANTDRTARHEAGRPDKRQLGQRDIDQPGRSRNPTVCEHGKGDEHSHDDAQSHEKLSEATHRFIHRDLSAAESREQPNA